MSSHPIINSKEMFIVYCNAISVIVTDFQLFRMSKFVGYMSYIHFLCSEFHLEEI